MSAVDLIRSDGSVVFEVWESTAALRFSGLKIFHSSGSMLFSNYHIQSMKKLRKILTNQHCCIGVTFTHGGNFRDMVRPEPVF